jgi:hypothetical protein
MDCVFCEAPAREEGFIEMRLRANGDAVMLQFVHTVCPDCGAVFETEEQYDRNFARLTQIRELPQP